MNIFASGPLFLLILFSSFVAVSASQIDHNFDAFATKTNATVVNVIVQQPDGKIIVGGNFQVANGRQRNSLARFNADGTLDENFIPSPGGAVATVLFQEDGKILIGGSSLGVIYNNTYRDGILRLNSDGSLDTTFLNGIGGYGVETIVRQPNGKILIGGSFTSFNGNQNVRRIARLNNDGSLDNSFSANADGKLYALAYQTDGKILVGGDFTLFNNQPKNFLVRINSDGSLDQTYTVTANYLVRVLKPLADGKILIGGRFTSIAGENRKTLARLNVDGTLDLGFDYINQETDDTLNTLAVQPDGKILLGGAFRNNYTSTLKGLYRLNSDGSIDNQFTPLADIGVLAVIYQANGRIVLGGFRNGEDLVSRVHIGALNSDGSPAQNFSASIGTFGTITTVLTQPNGKILVGGDFTEFNGKERRRITRLNEDGTLDQSFNPGDGANQTVRDIAVQPDGKIVLCGEFGLFNGISQYNLVRLQTDGSVDTSFITSVPFGSRITKCIAQPDGKIIINGSFSFYADVSRKNIARLNNDGSLDTSFDAGNSVAANAQTIMLQANGKILMSGQFAKGIMRLNNDGSLDSGFNTGTGAQGIISTFAVQPDGKIVIGGSFSAFNGVIRRNIARINNDGSLDPSFYADTQNVYALQIQTNGRTFVGGSIGTLNGVPVSYFASLNTDGTFDRLFNPGVGADNSIYITAKQTDGSIIVAGSFRKVDGKDHLGLAKIRPTPTSYDFDADGKSDISIFRPSDGAWYVQGSTNGFTGAQFGQSDDTITPADYDGDGKTDLAVYRSGVWYLQRSSQGFTGIQFGSAGDIPQPADYDGDGRADLAVFRPSTGAWYVNGSTVGFYGTQFGQNGDRPVAADYDGDGRADLAVYRSGVWYLNRSTAGFTGIQFGTQGDLVVPADYDGDGKTDLAVFRPSEGAWYLNRSSAGFTGIQFGQNGDLPAPADYDGDGKADLGVYRGGTWYLQRSTAGFTGVSFGATGDKPVPNAFVR